MDQQNEKIDPRRLRPSVLVRLLNSTRFGEVISDRQLRRHRNRAGYLVGDGKTVDLFRYAAWLTLQVIERTDAIGGYDAKREAAAVQSREESLSARDIGWAHPPQEPERRKAAESSFRVFCETYFPRIFYLPWSDDHLRVIEKIEKVVRSGGLFAMAMPRGSGKALALDTPMATPSGWTTMGDVQVGDYLFDERGRMCRVTYATPVMFGRPCYRVRFSDGEEIVCDEDHLWTVYDRYSRRNPLTLTTKQMVPRVSLPSKRWPEYRYRLPLAKPLQVPATNLPIAPYSLGVWLGDGSCWRASVTLAEWDYEAISNQVRWSGELLSKTSSEPEEHTHTATVTRTYCSRTSFAGRLRKLGLLRNKHIPPLYLRASYSQRMKLLQGILDTDGHADKTGHCEITIKYPKLADGFGELLSSLGIKYGRSEKYVVLDGKKLGPYHRFFFTVHDDTPAFLLRRKQARLRPRPKTQPLSKSRQIVAIEPTDSVPVRCIQVDSPSHLYLAGRKMVPTHNTVMCQCAVLWAALVQSAPFVCLIAASASIAKTRLDTIKIWLETNELLDADWNEVTHPIRKLQRIAARQKGQHQNGVPTRIEWTGDKIILPVCQTNPARQPVYRSVNTVISCSGMEGSSIRGQNHAWPDGSVVRPQLVFVDDPQTRESAGSPLQNKTREEILAGDVLYMPAPGRKVAGLMACTVIRPGDMADTILDRDKHPEWQGERTKMVYAFPSNEKLWAKYNEIRSDSLRNDGDGSEATEFYRQHRSEMDAGASVAWPERFNEDELSAIQHAMNLRFRDEEAFFAEYQNEPIVEEVGHEMLTAEEITAKLNGYQRGEIPINCQHLTMFIDVQGKLLYWLLCGWEVNFTGYVIDYGSWPDQQRSYYTLSDARRTLARAKPGAGLEGQIYAGLEALAAQQLGRAYRREDGTEMRVDRCLIDANWGQSTEVVYQFCRQSTFAGVLMPSHGKYVGASSKPFSEYVRKRGERVGLHWRMPSTRGRRQVRYVLIDTNYWKSFVHARLAISMGDPGCLSLFGRDGKVHLLLSEHLRAEYRVQTEARGRVVDEWKLQPSKPDNHWLDCLVGCAVAASMQGVSLAEVEAGDRVVKKRKRRDWSRLQEEMRQRGNQG